MSGFPGDFHVTFTDGNVGKYNGSFDLLDNGVLQVVDTEDGGKYYWFSPSSWLSIQKMTAP